jgi:hypothetical protein
MEGECTSLGGEKSGPQPDQNALVGSRQEIDRSVHLLSHGAQETTSTRMGRYRQRAMSQFD